MPTIIEFTCKISLLRGEPIVFKIAADDERRRYAVGRLEQTLDSPYIGLRLPDKLVLVPTHNIQSIEITPPLPNRMHHVINDAIQVEEE